MLYAFRVHGVAHSIFVCSFHDAFGVLTIAITKRRIDCLVRAAMNGVKGRICCKWNGLYMHSFMHACMHPVSACKSCSPFLRMMIPQKYRATTAAAWIVFRAVIVKRQAGRQQHAAPRPPSVVRRVVRRDGSIRSRSSSSSSSSVGGSSGSSILDGRPGSPPAKRRRAIRR